MGQSTFQVLGSSSYQNGALWSIAMEALLLSFSSLSVFSPQCTVVETENPTSCNKSGLASLYQSQARCPCSRQSFHCLQSSKRCFGTMESWWEGLFACSISTLLESCLEGPSSGCKSWWPSFAPIGWTASKRRNCCWDVQAGTRCLQTSGEVALSVETRSFDQHIISLFIQESWSLVTSLLQTHCFTGPRPLPTPGHKTRYVNVNWWALLFALRLGLLRGALKAYTATLAES